MHSNSPQEFALKNGGTNFLNIKKIYLSYPCHYFRDKLDLQFEICNEIANKFKIPFLSVKVAGSAHMGYSHHKDRPFLEKESDLDIAIIDHNIFQSLLEISLEQSNGYSPESFPTDSNGKSVRNQFSSYAARGIIRPDLMPIGPKRQEIWSFFNTLSNKHTKNFKSISAGFYLSETIYILKQRKSAMSSETEII